MVSIVSMALVNSTAVSSMSARGLKSGLASTPCTRRRCLPEVLLEQVLLVSAVYAYNLHALVNGIEQELGAVDLAHCADEFAVVVVPVHVMGGLPAEVPAGFDARCHISQYVADVLIVDNRMGASGRVTFRPFEGRLVRGARHADGSDTRDRA